MPQAAAHSLIPVFDSLLIFICYLIKVDFVL